VGPTPLTGGYTDPAESNDTPGELDRQSDVNLEVLARDLLQCSQRGSPVSGSETEVEVEQRAEEEDVDDCLVTLIDCTACGMEMAVELPKFDAGHPALLWERQVNESERAYQAFDVYRRLGLDRSLVKAAREVGKSRQLLERWSVRHCWQDRMLAWDSHRRRVEHAEWMERRSREAERRWIEGADERRRQEEEAARIEEKLRLQRSQSARRRWRQRQRETGCKNPLTLDGERLGKRRVDK